MHVVLVGHGHMGAALRRSWKKLTDIRVTVVSPQKPENLVAGDTWIARPEDLTTDAAVLVFAVKPQILHDVLPIYRSILAKGALGISIAAGTTLEQLIKLGATQNFVRAMPNLPIQKGLGVTGLQASKAVSAEGRSLAEKLFAQASEVIWCSSDDEMDKITAVFGSGPGFLFAMVADYIVAAKELGFSEAKLEAYVVKLFQGAAALLEDEHPETLCEQVTSPGGTTEAGLKKLRHGQALRKLLHEAFCAAVDRARELRS